MAEKRTRRRFTAGFKAQAVKRLLEGGKGLSEVATELRLSPGELSAWRTEHLAAGLEALAACQAEQAETLGQGLLLQPPQPLGDALLGTVQPGQEHAGAALNRVGHHRTLGEFQRQGCVDHFGRDLEQRGGERPQLLGGQAAMALVHGLGQRVGDLGAGADHRRLLDPEPHRDLIGGLEADAADVAGEAVGVVRDHLDRVGAVGLEDPHCPRGAHTMAVQEQHDRADHLLLGPARRATSRQRAAGLASGRLSWARQQARGRTGGISTPPISGLVGSA
jgi:transposase